jgi:hypothetical protein
MAIDERMAHRELMDTLKKHSAIMRKARLKSAYGKKDPVATEITIAAESAPDGSPEHEAAESPEMEAAEHETGVEMADEGGAGGLTAEELEMLLSHLSARKGV